MPDDHEIELKFLCEPQDLAKVLAAAAGEDETRELVSVYFDTPDGALQKRGASLRVRRAEGRRVQTLKRGEGLSREEHEAEIETDLPDPTVGPLRKLLPDPRQLRAAFEVRVTRRQRLIERGAATIELAADQGEVRSADRSAPICEVELELKQGQPRALFKLAQELSRAAPLYLSFESKAAQGQALLAEKPARQAVRLPADASAADAFCAVARDCLARIASNARRLREKPDPDTIHQLRVAARRLRSALSTFGPLFAPGEADPVKTELKWLTKACDPARNLDVFAEETVGPARVASPQARGVAALAQAVEGARARAQARAGQAASSERFRRLMIEAVGWVETGAWRKRAEGRRAAARFAAERLARRRRKLIKAAGRLEVLDDHGRHETRIEAKKLRYAAEAFASLFSAKPTRAFIGRLKTLQDKLGALNDLATAEPVIAGLALGPEAAFAAGELSGARQAKKPRLLKGAAKALDKLADARPFWRD